MFKFVLAFLIWLFATGKYQDWLALATTSGASSPASGTTSGTSSASATGGNILGALGSLGSLASTPTATGNNSTPADLISGYTG